MMPEFQDEVRNIPINANLERSTPMKTLKKHTLLAVICLLTTSVFSVAMSFSTGVVMTVFGFAAIFTGAIFTFEVNSLLDQKEVG